MRFAFLVLVLVLAGCGADTPEPSAETRPEAVSAGAGDPAPDFTLTGINGEPFTLSAYRGDVVVLNFWATWCLPCLAEMPDLEALHKELGDGVQIVGISQDTGDPAEVQQMVDRLGITYPILPDPAFQVAARFGGVPALPTTLFIGPDGRIEVREIGALPQKKIRALIEQTRATHS